MKESRHANLGAIQAMFLQLSWSQHKVYVVRHEHVVKITLFLLLLLFLEEMVSETISINDVIIMYAASVLALRHLSKW